VGLKTSLGIELGADWASKLVWVLNKKLSGPETSLGI
jgi:hypothetical protein